MASRSSANFFDLASGASLDIPQTPRTLPRVMTLPGIISDVANILPLHAERDKETARWSFTLDKDSLLLQLGDGFPPETEVLYVGCLEVEVEANEQEEIAQKLLDEFKCVPTFLPRDIQKKFYHGFCKQKLWSLFHYMLPICPDHGDHFDRQLWQAYVSANKIFADKVMEVVNPDDDFIWILDYHLMLLQQRQELQGKLELVQIVNPARSSGKDVQEAKKEMYSTAKKEMHSTARRINEVYDCPDYRPVILIDRSVDCYEKTAYYTVAECCIVNALRDGMNLVPYKYIVCRHGSSLMDKAMGIKMDSPRTSMLVVSEFMGCSASLSGAIRVNPWDIDSVAEAMNMAITVTDSEKQMRHEKHYRYISSHNVAYWACSFMQDLERACQNHYGNRCWGIGLGLSFRVLSLPPSFRKLRIDHIVSAYKRTNRRAIFLDYDGTIIPESSMIMSLNPEVITVLNALCNDPNNTMFIVSG
ncbi:hypothetical protein Fot_04420 [Forsythia ovata]|uniref:Trehalose-6-phosphate synthase n=1 Tax=Forsythia ovata TaxID=205694 RepID=A0ABD1XCH2_9LAMI